MFKDGGIRGILKDNALRIALVILILFLIMPLFFRDMSKDADGAPARHEAVAPPATRRGIFGAVKNMVDRFTRAYGLKGAPVIHIEERIAIPHRRLDADIDYPKALEKEAARVRANAAREEQEKQAARVAGGEAASAAEAPEYITLNGKGPYEVIEDSKGRKVIMLPEGPVLYAKFAKENISQEEVNAARKYAPKLKLNDAQLAEAIQYARENNYPGGVEKFLTSGEYARLSDNGRKSLFGGGSVSTGGRRGRGSGGAFGLGGGMDGTAENDTTVGGPGRIAYAGRTGISGAVVDKLKSSANAAKAAAKVEAKAKAEVTALSMEKLKAVITTPLIGDKPKEVDFVEKDIWVQQPTIVEEGTANLVIEFTEGTANLFLDNEDIRANMTKEIFCADQNQKTCTISFEGKIGKDVLKDTWVLPNKFEEGMGPGKAFAKANDGILQKMKEENKYNIKVWDDIDITYQNEYRPAIINALGKEPVPIAVIDYINGNDIKSAPENNYYSQTINYLLKDHFVNIGKGGTLNGLWQFSPAEVIIYAPEDAAASLKEAGFINIILIDRKVTPRILTKFGKDTVDAVANIQKERAARELAAGS
jgi:hypothetical protein